MTDDYKEQLLNYVTGNITPGQQSLNSIINGEENTNDFKQKLQQEGIYTANYRVISTDTTTNYIIYGNDNGGFIVILNQNAEVLEILTEYDSGTSFGEFLTLNFDENGNIYGIDYYNNKHRVILLNNVALKTSQGFYCKLRASYYIDETTFKVISPIWLRLGTSSIKKVIGEASYYILGQSTNNVMLYEFKINVGSTNEWNLYTGPSIQNGENLDTWDILLNKSGDNNVAYICYTTDYYPKKLFFDYFNGSTLTRTATYDIDTNIRDFRIYNNNTIYVSGISYFDDYDEIGFYEIINGTINTIENYVGSSNEQYSSYGISIVNGLVFTEKIYYNTNTSKYNLICGVYDGVNYIVSDVFDDDFIQLNCEIQETFSLYKFIIQTETTAYHPCIVIYDNDYSGGSYSNYNSLISAHGKLYNDNNVIFARNLYNKTILNNTTTSILEVPFNYINNVVITNQQLLGETQTVLVNNVNNITKNIYETVFFNFINTINVIDEDTDTSFINLANYVNTNINTGTETNYNNTKCSKFRINYEDETTSISTLEWLPINKYNKTTQITFYVDKNITSIDLISEDETTVYLNIPVEVEIGNTYTIRQKVRTGDKPTPVQLQYNNENINYNNEPVMVYIKEV